MRAWGFVAIATTFSSDIASVIGHSSSVMVEAIAHYSIPADGSSSNDEDATVRL
ncbi:hypothetical protein [Microseira sp. BLCC-F43]|uniref:hypothetical protein n=1 Tax=Microseira sp. BLCC-F43 TaxID=3153602 RepID=UPI0035BAF7B9